MTHQTLSWRMRLFVSMLCVLLAVPLSLMPVAPARADDTVLSVVNVAGTSRYDTAVEASKLAYPAGLGEGGAKTVIIATGRNWPDALGGSALAGALDGPILLVNTNSVPAAVLGEIERLGATDAVIVGGGAAVGPAVVTTLEGAGLSVERIAGGSRYETADKVALRVIEEMGGDFDGTAFVATGGTYADAVAAAPLAAAFGWPLYLAHPSRGISADTKAAMTDVRTALVLGGQLAVSAAVETGLWGDLGYENVERLAGDSRYKTAVAIAEHGIAHTSPDSDLAWDRVGIATGQDYPHALAGGVLQGKMGSVMLLTRTASLPDETRAALSANKATITTVTYFGGQLAVGQTVREAVAAVFDPNVVTLVDANLEAAVRGALSKPTGDITVSDMEGLTGLYAGSSGITDLTGLEHAVNLTELHLHSNEISDISALEGLTSLDSLGLHSNDIYDVSAIAGLTDLTYLDLESNEISDISVLEGLTSLQVLSLGSNGISDISALAGLTDLRALSLGWNEISDISVLEGLTSLDSLGLHSNEISDITVLAGLTSLDWLNLNSNEVSDISVLEGLTSLQVLSLGSNGISDISALAGSTDLRVLNLNSNEVSDISVLEGLTSLKQLYLESNKISDISALAGLTDLRALSLGWNEISDISVLEGLTSLDSLGLESNDISDISALVANTGFGCCDAIELADNYLDLTPGSQNMNDIEALEDRGVYVSY